MTPIIDLLLQLSDQETKASIYFLFHVVKSCNLRFVLCVNYRNKEFSDLFITFYSRKNLHLICDKANAHSYMGN